MVRIVIILSLLISPLSLAVNVGLKARLFAEYQNRQI
ncbi:hypothetical protein ND16A_1785 [Thalassotalea sp. ND16A]|nr:hypothetical protein ND16A_1785 [Thalassotalea sp. ND16A]